MYNAYLSIHLTYPKYQFIFKKISDIPLTLKSFESTMKLFSGPKPFLPLRKHYTILFITIL